MGDADSAADSTPFIEYMLQALHHAMTEALATTSEKTSEKIVAALLRDKSLTISELAERIGVTTRSVERNLQKLQDDGLLRRLGAAKGGSWEVVK